MGTNIPVVLQYTIVDVGYAGLAHMDTCTTGKRLAVIQSFSRGQTLLTRHQRCCARSQQRGASTLAAENTGGWAGSPADQARAQTRQQGPVISCNFLRHHVSATPAARLRGRPTGLGPTSNRKIPNGLTQNPRAYLLNAIERSPPGPRNTFLRVYPGLGFLPFFPMQPRDMSQPCMGLCLSYLSLSLTQNRLFSVPFRQRLAHGQGGGHMRWLNASACLWCDNCPCRRTRAVDATVAALFNIEVL